MITAVLSRIYIHLLSTSKVQGAFENSVSNHWLEHPSEKMTSHKTLGAKMMAPEVLVTGLSPAGFPMQLLNPRLYHNPSWYLATSREVAALTVGLWHPYMRRTMCLVSWDLHTNKSQSNPTDRQRETSSQ